MLSTLSLIHKYLESELKRMCIHWWGRKNTIKENVTVGAESSKMKKRTALSWGKGIWKSYKRLRSCIYKRGMWNMSFRKKRPKSRMTNDFKPGLKCSLALNHEQMPQSLRHYKYPITRHPDRYASVRQTCLFMTPLCLSVFSHSGRAITQHGNGPSREEGQRQCELNPLWRETVGPIAP